jgi:hypothetical protein
MLDTLLFRKDILLDKVENKRSVIVKQIRKVSISSKKFTTKLEIINWLGWADHPQN